MVGNKKIALLVSKYNYKQVNLFKKLNILSFWLFIEFLRNTFCFWVRSNWAELQSKNIRDKKKTSRMCSYRRVIFISQKYSV